MNQYIDDLIYSLNGRYSVESAGMTTGEWICANTKYRGRQFSFEGYRFQEEIANDLHPELDVMKISQVGLTEVQARKSLAMLLRNPGRVGIFSLPDEIMYRRFSQQRLQPLVKDNKVFNSDMNADSVRSMALMQFGQSFLHVVHAVEGSATSIPADFVFNDEVDLSDQKILALFASRLQNSDWKIKQRFSTPSWTGYGIDATYGAGDQREYFCKCRACTHWQVPLFDRKWVRVPGLDTDTPLSDVTTEMLDGVDLSNSFVACERCNAPLDLDDEKREWVATHPARMHARGYRVRPFSSGRIGIGYIITQLLDYRRRDYLRGWYNTVLGEPYNDSQARLDEAQIKACMGGPGVPEISSSTQVFMGIDVGQICHVVLGAMRGSQILAFLFKTVRVQDILPTVSELCSQYNIVSGATDRHPYTPTAEGIRDLTDGRVMPIEYRGSMELKPIMEIGTETVIHWQADRTKIIDDLAQCVRRREIEFAGYGIQSAVITEHLRDMIRDETPEKPARWIKLNGNDHYFHALAFLRASMKLPGVLAQISDAETRSTIMMGTLGAPKTKNLFGNQKPNRFIRPLI